MKRLRHILLIVSLLLAWLPSLAAAQTPAATPPTATEASKTAEEIKAEHRKRAMAFLGLYKPISGVVSTRVGNSNGGTTEETPGLGRTRAFIGGAPMRLSIPHTVDRVGLEWPSLDKTRTPNIRLQSGNNEGGWHQTYVDPRTGKVLGGMFDVAFPRTDYKNKTVENGWQFGTGWWIDGGLGKESQGDGEYRQGVPFVELKRGKKIGDDSGTPGYSWVSDESGFVMRTPWTTLYGLVTFGSAVTDPKQPGLVFSLNNSHWMDWRFKGNGKEHRNWRPSFDFEKYPTDPRHRGRPSVHNQPLAAVRVGKTLYWYTAANDINVYRWDETARVMVPVASVYFRPDELNLSLPDPPSLTWGQGLIVRPGADGIATPNEYQIITANCGPLALWNGYAPNIDPQTGDVYLLPQWSEIKDAGDGAIWKTFDAVKGIFHTDNLKSLILPAYLKTAPGCVQLRIHPTTGDLYAIVEREGVFRLERYIGWKTDTAVKPVYSVGPVALSRRRLFEWWSEYNKETAAPYDPKQGFMVASHGTMAVCGEYAFMIEGQSQGIRVHRLKDGAYVGRWFDRKHQNSSQDDPNGISVTETATEYRIFNMDFHGKSVLVRRIPKAALR